MARALTAWLTAPAPIACTSTLCRSRITPAIAPATAVGREVAATLMISEFLCSSVLVVAPGAVVNMEKNLPIRRFCFLQLRVSIQSGRYGACGRGVGFAIAQLDFP